MKQILALLFVLLCAFNCCRTIAISEPVTSVPYDSSRIAVWENGRGKYFFMPLAQMINNSASIAQNVLTGRMEINFRILMWSVQAKEAVLVYLNQHVNISLVEADVEALPMRKVRLLWKDRLRPLDPAYQLVDHWRSNFDTPSVLTFQIICSEKEKCDSLKNSLNTSPDLLYALELDYVLNMAQTQIRMISVTGNHVIGGELYRKLSSMPSTSAIRYLTSADLLILARQTVANAISDVITDKIYVDNSDEASLSLLLQKVWQKRSLSAATLLPATWTSVHWPAARARPDKLVHYLNQVLTNDPENSENFLLDSNWKSLSDDLDVNLDLRGIFNTTSSNASVSNAKTRISKSLVLRKLRDGREGRNVLWSKEEFRVGPIPLYRLNLASLNASRSLVSGPVEVREYESVRSVRVRPPGSQTTGSDLTPELVQSRVQESVRKLRMDVNERIATIAGVFDSWPGDVLCDVETDKATVALDLEEEGILAKIIKPENTSQIKIGELIAVMVEEGDDWKTASIPDVEIPDSGSSADTGEATEAKIADKLTKAGIHTDGHLVGPAVKNLLEMYPLTIDDVTGTGRNGVVLKGDVLEAIKSRSLKPQPKVAAPSPSPSEVPKAAPTPSPQGPAGAPSELPPRGAPPRRRGGTPYEDVELTNMRRTIAKRLTESKTSVPHAYSVIDCRMDQVLALRVKLKSQGIKLSVNDFVIKAVAMALRQVPEVNASLSGEDSVQLLPTVDISVAVATKTGLITPIVWNADLLGLTQISQNVQELSQKARDGKLKPGEFMGGSFTISNLGMFGISEFTGVINPPQACILAVGASNILPSPDGNAVTLMRVTTSSDGRVIDQPTAARFLQAFKQNMENPEMMPLGVSSTSESDQILDLDAL